MERFCQKLKNSLPDLTDSYVFFASGIGTDYRNDWILADSSPANDPGKRRKR